MSLADESLTGTLPASLSDLPDLTHLDLSDNSLTGSIPHALTELDDLLVLKLSGNSLTGCIPAGLKSVTTNDLASLGLSYCPTAPAGLAQAAGAAENTVPLTWNALTGAAKYRVEYRLLSQGYWELSDVTITGTTHTLEDLECSRNYKVRVTAYGNGTAHAAEWGTPSDPITVEDGGCFAAMFSPAEYSYTVNTDARPGTRLGTITATGSRGAQDTVTYRLIDGHYGGQFALDSATGHLTVANALDDFAGETYHHYRGSTGRERRLGRKGHSYCQRPEGMFRRDSGDQSGVEHGAGGGLQDAAGAEERPGGDGVVELERKPAHERLGRHFRKRCAEARHRGEAQKQQPGRGHPGGPWGTWSKLQDLWLGGNQLTGEIPPELGNLTSLYSLYLDQNRLTGEIPAELGSLSALEDLFLYNNQLTGSIPPEVSGLEELGQLWITNNQLTGVLPGELAGSGGAVHPKAERQQLRGLRAGGSAGRGNQRRLQPGA